MTPVPTPERWAAARAYEWDIDLPERAIGGAATPSPAPGGTTPGGGFPTAAGHPSTEESAS